MKTVYAVLQLIMLCILGQHKRSVSDVKEDATVSEGAKYGEWFKIKQTPYS